MTQIIDGYTGTERLYNAFVKTEAVPYKVTLKDFSDEQYKQIYLKFVTGVFLTFKGGKAMADLNAGLHETENREEWRAYYETQNVSSAIKTFVEGLEINTFPGLNPALAEVWTSTYAPSNVHNTMVVNSQGSVFNWKLMVPKNDWTKRKSAFRKILVDAVKSV